ncbi:MAG TPA: LolA-related protein [Burkholderiales bacterium]|nr:LolA-related protein [Burkholderiales bacterium]
MALAAPSTPAADLDLPALMAMLAAVPAAKESFTESKRSALLSAPLVLKGTLVYGRPDRLEKHVLSPYQETTVIAGGAVTIENRGLKQKRSFTLSSSSAITALIEGMRATLAGDAPALERHYRIRLEGAPDSWLLTLTPRDEKLAGLVTSIRIAGARERLKRIEIDEGSGDQSVMLIGPEAP